MEYRKKNGALLIFKIPKSSVGDEGYNHHF